MARVRFVVGIVSWLGPFRGRVRFVVREQIHFIGFFFLFRQ